jgi:hypothetical protein
MFIPNSGAKTAFFSRYSSCVGTQTRYFSSVLVVGTKTRSSSRLVLGTHQTRHLSDVPAVIQQGSNSKTLGEITRHGQGDACIKLCVGGEVFQTLRSTVATNSVLADHVARAEVNSEVTLEGAVFIDRDPKHFAFVLQYLRNKADADDNYTKTGLERLHKAIAGDNYSLPRDAQTLGELYQEAIYYRIKELQDYTCGQNYISYALSFFGSGNPFATASKLFGRARAALIAFGSIGTAHVSTNEESRTAIFHKIAENEVIQTIMASSS